MGLCLPVPVLSVKLKLDDALEGMNRSVVATVLLLLRVGDTLRDDANDAAREDGPISLMGEATPVITDVRFRGDEEADRNESTDRPSCC
mmetsp:Transcript_14193/g.23176  ORF Transcript_14193/g.23176 Transcript_14193/m.23176 type:complete len:89 (+) Transcript_14193:199-465(+)